MRLKYKTSLVLLPALLGLCLVLMRVFAGKLDGWGAGMFLYGLAMMGLGLQRWLTGYLVLEPDAIQTFNMWPKKIPVASIVSVKKFAGDWIVNTERQEHLIGPGMVTKEAGARLETYFQELAVKVQTKPVA